MSIPVGIRIHGLLNTICEALLSSHPLLDEYAQRRVAVNDSSTFFSVETVGIAMISLSMETHSLAEPLQFLYSALASRSIRGLKIVQ